MRLADAVRNAMVDAAVDQLDDGAAAGELRIYTGTAPASIASAPAGTLLATLPFDDPAFGAAGSGSATAAGLPNSATAAATGTAGYARFVDSDGNAKWDTEDVGTAGTEEVVLDNLSIASGQTVNLVSASFTQPAGAV